MKTDSIEMAVGVFVLIGLCCVAYLTIRLGKMEIIGNNNYSVIAKFRSVSGLKNGARVEIAGVGVGKVDSISLDQQKEMASVTMKIEKNIILDDEVIASIRTSGLIGDKFIKLTPGGSDVILKNGGQITETESALDIEELISKYVFSDNKK